MSEQIPNNTSREDQLTCLIKQNDAIAVFFHRPECGICAPLENKLKHQLNKLYPKLVWHSEQLEQSISILQQPIAGVPTLAVFFQGKFVKQWYYAFSVSDVIHGIQRPYQLLFAEH